jgi:type I restriction-modification system DNA methylase subunit
MDTTSLQNLLKRLCKVMWESNVTDPLTYVTQIAYLLCLKMLEEMDAEQNGSGGPQKREIFATVKLNGDSVDFARLRWSILTSNPDHEKMLATLRDLLPKLAFHPALSPGARAIFDDARIVIPDGATLRRAVDLISPIHLLSEDADVKGDLFETLSSDLGQQKRSAQFRTPRHLIRVIVEMVNPEIGRTVCDSACGTGGFLIAAYEHILLANTSPEFIREVAAPGGLTVRRGIGDRLLAECDLQAVVTLPKGMFEPYTPNPTCFLVFQKTGKPTESVWFYRVEGDGSSLKKARKFGPQFRNDFPDLLKKWPRRQTADGVAWRVPAQRIIENGYNLTLASLGLVEPEKTDHAEPEDILASVAEKERRILEIVEEMRELVTAEDGK